MATQSPWWGIPLIAGIFGVAGVSLTLLANYVRDRRDQRRRWEREVRELAARFIAVLRTFANNVEWDPDKYGRELSELYIEIELIAPKEIVQSAGKMMGPATRLGVERRAGAPDARDSLTEWSKAQAEFTDEVRKYFGLDALPSPSTIKASSAASPH
jgi:hypothetical protein